LIENTLAARCATAGSAKLPGIRAEKTLTTLIPLARPQSKISARMSRNRRIDPQIGFIVVTLAGLLSGAVSGYAATLSFETVPGWLPPFLPGFVYGGLTGSCLAAMGATGWGRAMMFSGIMVVSWAIGLQLAPLTCANWLTGGGVGCTLYSAGLLAGFAGTGSLIVIAAFLFPGLRKLSFALPLLILGTAAGALLELGPYWVFCGWQVAANALIGWHLFLNRA